jgi:hypothetical protein
MRFKDDTGCCGCLFIVVMSWLILIAIIGGYKLFKWILEL